MSITHVQLRKLFSDFWKSKDHKEIPSIPLVPQNDPTTLFTGSGMQQLVPYLLGEPHPLGKKLYNIQPCFRSQDIEEIGDNRHTTFFEMMGNWSLGTYFKEEQLRNFFIFLTDKKKGLGRDPSRLYVSVFGGDPDFKVIDNKKHYQNLAPDFVSMGIWKKLFEEKGLIAEVANNNNEQPDISNGRIFYYGPEKNWWSRAGIPKNMPIGEPGGPDSEVFYDFGEEYKFHEQSKFREKPCHPNCDCGRFLEIGNSVFMQYKKIDRFTFEELPNKNVDFGGGLERMLAVGNDNPDVFAADVDGFVPIIKSIESYTGKNYVDVQNKSYIRIIADHLKAAIFLIKDGIKPSNKDRGSILRRLLTHSGVKFAQLTNTIGTYSGLDFDPIIHAVIDIYPNYFNMDNDFTKIKQIIVEEMNRFGSIVKRGLKKIEKTPVEELNGDFAFNLFQTDGIPLEITKEIFRLRGKGLNEREFENRFKTHQDLSRKSAIGMFKGGLADYSEQTLKYHTATHLLHQALFDVLGNDIRQEGSNITVERLRFDFYSGKKPTDEEMKKVGEIMNKKIKESFPVLFKIMPKEEALKIGARSFFREKYPDMVKVYSVGDYSKEFCGGPHVTNTKDIGKIEIYKFEKIGSNLYRVYAK